MDQATEQMDVWYREFGPALLAYFRHQPALTMIAEDLLQDTFVRALRRPERVQGSISPRAYFFGIARHVSVDALRRLRPVDELPADSPAPVAVEDARIEQMRAAIDRLPDLHREALVLKLQHELTYAEIAAVLGVPLGTVRSRLHHAVALLKEMLGAQ